MHGLILTEFKEYVVDADHAPTWDEVAHRAEVADREYDTGTSYPDEEVVRVAQATADLMDTTTREVLIEYGEKVMYSLHDIYRPLIEDDWGSLELMMEVEERFHPTVRERSGGKPPLLEFERRGPHEVTLTYKSPRNLCGIAIGTAHALRKMYDEDITIQEERCVHEGADHCFIRFIREPASSSEDGAVASASRTQSSV
jgi:hypothetical protein